MWRQLFKVNGILAAWLRRRKFTLLIFVLKHSARLGITANVYTLLGLVLCGAASVVVARGQIRRCLLDSYFFCGNGAGRVQW
jgi:hypothetical protein